jgi:hypothetical protein
MSANPLFRSTMLALDAIFPAEPVTPALAEEDTLAFDERTSRVLSNGDVVVFDLYQINADCWTAKDANHDGRTGVDDTREGAIADLLQLCEDDLEDCDIEDPTWRPQV